ncbi:MAG: GIY-YIG nuclease family protein [Sinobacteraceae bacterium]|nr:GIY-YIG nuclease family protein [Nevskiaceae bacterium]
MGDEHQYYVYILTNSTNRVLYTGVTNNLERRIAEHKQKRVPGFTQRYNVDRLVFYETGMDVYAALSREKQIKAGSRQKKIELIESVNQQWRDLSDDWKT